MKKFRLKILIYPKFQLKLILTSIVLNFIAFFILYLNVEYFFDSLLNAGEMAGAISGDPFFNFVQSQKDKLTKLIFLSLILSTIITSIIFLWISQKIAGPLVRLQGYLKYTIETGDIKKLTFRKGDYFLEIAELVNKLLEKK